MNCELHKGLPEHTEVDHRVWLEHFQNCITQEHQLTLVEMLRTQAGQGHLCFMADHRGLIDSQARYAAKLRAGIRALVEECQAAGLHGVVQKLQALIL